MFKTLSEEDYDDLVLIQKGEDLKNFRLLETNKLEALSEYDLYLRRIQRGFDSYYESNVGKKLDNRPYQMEYAAIMCCRRNNIMGWQMGSGKTLSSLLMLYGLYAPYISSMRAACIHIVVFNLLSSMRWIEELERFPIFRDKYKVITRERDLADCEVPIIIYSQDFPKNLAPSRRGNTKKSMARVLGRFRPCCLIVDEVHGLKNNSTRTKQLTYIRSRSRRVLALTGTPADGNLKELHNILKFVYSANWPYNSANIFSKHFGAKEKFNGSYLYGSSLNPDAPEKYLQKLDPLKIAPYYKLMRRFIHRLKLDEPQVRSCMTLPESEVLMHKVKCSAEQERVYREYVNKHKAQLQKATQTIEGSTPKRLAEALRLIHPLIKITNHPLELYPQVTLPKLQRLEELVKSAEGKVVVFCDRVDSAWLCSSHLRQALCPEAVIRLYANDEREEIESLDTERRIEVVTQFQYSKEIKVGVFSVGLAAQAIDLTEASDVIYYCLPWSSIRLQQSINRVVRSGNPYNKVKLHYLYQEGLIDEYQVNLSLEKVKNFRLMLDYEIDEVSDDELSDLTPMELIKKLLGG
jgi:SNF2 family DNA or RNA helicase